MNKSDLNSSMLFKIRDYGLCVLLERTKDDKYIFYAKDAIVKGVLGGVSSLDEYNDNLKIGYSNMEQFDIIAIKQYKSCTEALHVILDEEEPKEWDWVEEEVSVKIESGSPIVNNITINITVDPNIKIDDFVKQLSKKLDQNCINLGIC